MATSTKHHQEPKCNGFGVAYIKQQESVVSMLCLSLEHHGFVVKTRKIGASQQIKYGSETCEDCKKWLRR